MNTIEKYWSLEKDMCFKEPFYGMLLMNLVKRIEKHPDRRTACVYVSGIDYNLEFHEDFLNALFENCNEKQRVSILKHEMLHLCFEHLPRAKDFRDRDMMLIAADLAVNCYLPDIPTELDVRHGDEVEHMEFIDWNKWSKDLNLEPFKDIKYYYDKLMEQKESLKNRIMILEGGAGGDGEGQEQNDDNQQGNNQGGQKDNNQQYEEEGENGNGNGEGVSEEEEGGKNSGGGGGTNQGQEKEKYYVGKIDDQGLNETQKTILRETFKGTLEDIAKEVQKSCGKLPGEIQKALEIEIEEEKFDYRAFLRRFRTKAGKVVFRKSKRKQSKRFADMEGQKGKDKCRILCFLDNSGSMSQEEIVEEYSQLTYGTRNCHIYYSCFDVEVTKPKKVPRGNVFDFSGGGGTDPQVCVDYARQHFREFDAFIMFTDGEFSLPTNVPPNFLFVLSSKTQVKELEGLNYIKMEDEN
jgi:predicted metal-dependent peptidase